MVEITKPDPRILVIRMSSLGDIILTAPVFRNLKARWPGSRLDILVKPQFLEAVSKNAFLNRALPFTGLGAALREINAASYDAIIDLHDTPRSRLICALARSPVKLRYRKASMARRLFVGLRIPSPALEKHTLDRYLEPLAELGVPLVHRGPELGDWVPGTRKPAFRPGPLKICLLQTAFLGDCVLTLPLLKKLREVFPGAAVSVVTRPETADIFSAAGLAAEIIVDRKKTAPRLAEFGRLARELRSRDFDAVIIPHRSLRSALLAWRARIPVRVGFSSSAGSFLLTHKVPFSWLLHDVERNLALLSPLAENLKAASPGLPAGPAPSALLTAGAAKAVAGINAGSAWPTKRWPSQKWARLIKKLAAAHTGRVLMVGGPGEREWNAEIERLAGPENCINLTGKTTMPELMEAIRPLKVFISNDSGPMHIAAALGVPAVGVFGPTTRELGFFPYGPGHKVVETPLACRPCALHGSKKCPRGHFLCMRLLTVDEVFEAAKGAL